MSGTTFTWTGAAADLNWNDPANWSGGTATALVPNGANDVAIVTVNGVDGNQFPIISGNSLITLSSLSSAGSAHVIVGGSQLGGTGTGNLTAGSISVTSTNTGGGLVGGPGSTITTPSLTVGTGVIIGGGGAFHVTSLANSGIIQADGGNFNLGALTVTGGTITGTGSIEVDSDLGIGNSTFDLGSATAETIDVVVAPTQTATVIFENPASYTGTVNLATANTHLNLIFNGGPTPTGASFDPVSSTLIVTAGTAVIDTVKMTSNGLVGPVSVGPTGEVSIGAIVWHEKTVKRGRKEEQP